MTDLWFYKILGKNRLRWNLLVESVKYNENFKITANEFVCHVTVVTPRMLRVSWSQPLFCKLTTDFPAPRIFPEIGWKPGFGAYTPKSLVKLPKMLMPSGFLAWQNIWSLYNPCGLFPGATHVAWLGCKYLQPTKKIHGRNRGGSRSRGAADAAAAAAVRSRPRRCRGGGRDRAPSLEKKQTFLGVCNFTLI